MMLSPLSGVWRLAGSGSFLLPGDTMLTANEARLCARIARDWKGTGMDWYYPRTDLSVSNSSIVRDEYLPFG